VVAGVAIKIVVEQAGLSIPAFYKFNRYLRVASTTLYRNYNEILHESKTKGVL
jgi:hypothetical protein